MAKKKDFKVCLDGSWYKNDSINANTVFVEADYFRYCHDKEIEVMISTENKNGKYVAEVEEFLIKSGYSYKRNDTYLTDRVMFTIYEYAEIHYGYNHLDLRFRESLERM